MLQHPVEVSSISGSSSNNNAESERPVSTGKQFVVFLLVAAVAYVVVLAGFGKGQLIYGVPTYEDDYRTLAYSIDNIPFIACRPIAFYTSFFMGSFGGTFTYIAAQVMAVLTIALSFTFVATYLEVRRLYWPAILCAVVCAVSVENLVDYSRYLAVLFGLYSSIFGFSALICFVRAFRSDQPRSWMFLAVGLTILGLLCKEEFFGPIICFCLWCALPIAGEKNRHLAKVSAITLICACAAILAFEKFVLHSPFLGSGAAYSISLSPGSILSTYWSYITNCRGTIVVAIANATALIYSVMLCGKQSTIRVAVVTALSILIMAPFALIPQHFLEIYTIEWTSLQCASLLVLCCSDETKIASKAKLALTVVLFAMIPVVVSLTNPLRCAKFAWHDNRAAFNAKVIAWLSEHRDQLNKHKVVSVKGLPLGSPWYGNDGAFLKNKLGLNCSWLILTPKNSELYNAQVTCAALKCGTIEVRALEPDWKQEGPLLLVSEDGSIEFMGKRD